MSVLADLAELVRHPRRWWRNATHAPCPVCGISLDVGRDWRDHKATHDPREWSTAVAARTEEEK